MTTSTPLDAYGWNDAVAKRLKRLLAKRQIAGRVIRVDRGEVDVVDATGATVRATMTTAAKDCVAGDWVASDPETSRVEGVAPRATAFTRRAARGANTAQTLAANMDVVLVCQALDPGLNVRRLERELVLAHQSGATPVVVLTKTDVVGPDATAASVADAQGSAPGCDVIAVSNRTRDGLDRLLALVRPRMTFALLGASGVGKSTLVNTLAGESVQLVAEIRAGDGKGKHTTTAARLIRLSDDRLLLDTPGVRALALWESWEGLALAFSDVEDLAGSCRFADCFHEDEPGCAVIAGTESGVLDPARLASWRHLREEMDQLDDALIVQTRKRERTGRPTAPPPTN